MELTRQQIPEGMQDVMPGQCALMRRCENSLRKLFSLSGYQEVQTPMLEFLSVFTSEDHGISARKMWKTFDREGRILTLRPDSTAPAVRLASTRLFRNLPARLSYIQSIATCEDIGEASLNENTQAGVELIGANGAEADAEIIALAARCLRAVGLDEFLIDLGQVEFFYGLMEEAGLSRDTSLELAESLAKKDILGMELLLSRSGASKEAMQKLMLLPSLYGGEEVFERAEKLSDNPRCQCALKNLKDILAALDVYGLRSMVSIDLGLIYKSYYNGMIFRGITDALGQPLISGGRYDGLPQSFSLKAPATGFGLNLSQLMIALERKNGAPEIPVTHTLVGFCDGALATAARLCEDERSAGRSAALIYDGGREKLTEMLTAGSCKAAVWIGKSGKAEKLGGEAK